MSKKDLFKKLEARALSAPRQTLVLAAAGSEEALLAAESARVKGIVDVILVGHAAKITEYAARHGITLNKYQVIDEPDDAAAARRSVELVRSGQGSLLMKGLVQTGDFLKAVLDKEAGLRTRNRLCSVVVLDSARLDRPLVLADVGTNIAPNVDEKAGIIESCFIVSKALGTTAPKAAVLCAQENVQTAAMPVSVEGAVLAKMAERGQLNLGAGGGLVEGPISMDLAVNPHAAELKKFGGAIRGDADILIAPDLQSGNILVKGLMYLSGDVKIAGVGMGAAVPLVLTSRGDDHETKYNSILIATLIGQLQTGAASQDGSGKGDA